MHVDARMQIRSDGIGNLNLGSDNLHEMGQEALEEENVDFGLALNQKIYM